MKRGQFFRAFAFASLPAVLCVALLAGGCHKDSEAKHVWPNPPMPDGTTVLRVGMSLDELRQVLGDEGVTRQAPADAEFKEGLEFDQPSKFPAAHLYVALSPKDKSVMGWTMLRPHAPSASGPSVQP